MKRIQNDIAAANKIAKSLKLVSSDADHAARDLDDLSADVREDGNRLIMLVIARTSKNSVRLGDEWKLAGLRAELEVALVSKDNGDVALYLASANGVISGGLVSHGDYVKLAPSLFTDETTQLPRDFGATLNAVSY